MHPQNYTLIPEKKPQICIPAQHMEKPRSTLPTQQGQRDLTLEVFCPRSPGLLEEASHLLDEAPMSQQGVVENGF